MWPSALSSPKALSSALVWALLSSAELALARPEPQPNIHSKTEWSHNRGKKVARTVLRHALERRQTSVNETVVAASPGFDGSAPYAAKAPYDNIWGGLSDTEAASVIAWLFAQPSLNLTVSENATGWDNSM